MRLGVCRLWQDLGQKDLLRDRVFLVSQVIRCGRMQLTEAEQKKETHNLRRPFGIAGTHPPHAHYIALTHSSACSALAARTV